MPILRAHDEKTSLTWSVQVRLLLKWMPRCLWWSTCGTVTPPIEIDGDETRTCLLLTVKCWLVERRRGNHMHDHSRFQRDINDVTGVSLSLPLTKVTYAQYRKRFRASYNVKSGLAGKSINQSRADTHMVNVHFLVTPFAPLLIRTWSKTQNTNRLNSGLIISEGGDLSGRSLQLHATRKWWEIQSGRGSDCSYHIHTHNALLANAFSFQ